MLARGGLKRLQSEEGVKMLAPLEEIARTGRSVADHVVDVWNGAGGDPKKIIPALALK